MSAYFLVSLHADTFKAQSPSSADTTTEEPASHSPFEAHLHWDAGTTWKSALNNLRLLLKPYCCWMVRALALTIPGLRRGFCQLMDCMDTFQSASIPEAKSA